MAKPSQNITERPPIVVVMGHVDHGKSTLLDFIRKSNVVAKEAGGITQHVAAYEVERVKDGSKKRITFIDTPGHAAFKAIRARGANVADIAILVVAADDGIKEQTLEALASIREAKIPFIVAINKIDKPKANVAKTQGQLMEKEVYLEKLGGDVPWTAISAKIGTGVDELLDVILLVAELEALTADAGIPAEGYVIEAHRDPKRGIAATLIITNGTLSLGMAVLAGRALSPVRIMENHAGVAIRSATFSTPISLTGFDELPVAGESFKAYKSKRDAESERSALQRDKPTAPSTPTATSAENELSEKFVMPIVVRADTTGSLEAITHEAARIGDTGASVDIILSGIGNISENDIKTAAAASIPVLVIGFNVEADAQAIERARQSGVRIETFNIIYKLAEKLQELLLKSAPKRVQEEVLGKAKVVKCFSNRKELHVVGGSVSEGSLARNASVRVLRRKVVIGTGKIKNLQTNKQDVDKVETGAEFGAQIEAGFEIIQGDILECFKVVTK